MAFGQEGVEIEEGYITFPTLPGGFLAKVGKLKAQFGKENTFHAHQRIWPDQTLMQANLLGGEEGIADAGVSVSRLLLNPWFFLEATGEVYRGRLGGVHELRARRPVVCRPPARLRRHQRVGQPRSRDVVCLGPQ